MMTNRLMATIGIVATVAAYSCTAAAAPFTPVIDEFWVVKGDNGGTPTQTFRDSFNDGALPPSGPQDGAGGNPDTYTVFGSGGLTGETGPTTAALGKLTMTPSNGDQVLITTAYADMGTVVTKLRSTANGNVNSLELADSFEIHGLYDLTSLPEFTGQNFGIRASDRATNLGNEGDDTIQLVVGRNVNTGVLGVALHELDFGADTIDRVDFFDIESIIDGGLATQIELVITKDAGTAEIGAYFTIYGAGGMLGGNVLLTHNMDTFSTEQGANLAIYGGEDYTRAQFVAHDRVAVPAPASLGLFGLGLAGLGWMRRRASAR
jgi:hypothetical protein